MFVLLMSVQGHCITATSLTESEEIKLVNQADDGYPPNGQLQSCYQTRSIGNVFILWIWRKEGKLAF